MPFPPTMQVLKATTALMAHLKKEAKEKVGRNLLDAEPGASTSVYMQLTLKRIPGRQSNKPMRM